MRIQPPKIPSFFRAPKHKQFDYTPRYYDEEAEKRENRKKGVQREDGRLFDMSALHRGIGKFRSSERKNKNGRLAIILAALLLAVYFLLK